MFALNLLYIIVVYAAYLGVLALEDKYFNNSWKPAYPGLPNKPREMFRILPSSILLIAGVVGFLVMNIVL